MIADDQVAAILAEEAPVVRLVAQVFLRLVPLLHRWSSPSLSSDRCKGQTIHVSTLLSAENIPLSPQQAHHRAAFCRRVRGSGTEAERGERSSRVRSIMEMPGRISRESKEKRCRETRHLRRNDDAGAGGENSVPVACFPTAGCVAKRELKRSPFQRQKGPES